MTKEVSRVVPYSMGIKYVDLPTFPDLFRWEEDNWQDESMSWKESCYVHSGISGNVFRLTGPDAQALLSYMAINNVYKWKIGFSKHLVFLDEEGYIRNHKLTIRDSEDSFRIFGTNSPVFIQKTIEERHFDVKMETIEMCIYQISGPLSLTVIEKVTGQDQRDLKFLQTKPITIPGIPAKLELARIGMSGTLAYEIRGAMDDGIEVYNKIYEAGKPYGMQRLGWRTYTVNHTEGGFPQGGCSFFVSFMLDRSFINEQDELDPNYAKAMGFKGSIDPSDYAARLRTPGQVNWLWMANFDHDFIGKEALLKEKENPKQKLVTLVWNKEDIQDVFMSLFEQGEPYKFMEFPNLGGYNTGGHTDAVIDKDGKRIGLASVGHYSYYYREIISETVLDIDQAEIGNEVTVLWGDYGKRIKPIRARVERYPYLQMPSNKNYDLDTVPKGY
ncbi:MAG: hypothetical protein LIO94_12645 [Clostridiales bacterium]|nr:hypothetical protein [Clostridiales bacterium]